MSALRAVALFRALWIAVGTSVDDLQCTLSCENGGYCSYVATDIDVLTHEVQSGQLIQKCICQPGFGGLGCEIEVEECAVPERMCHNGLPCVETAAGDWKCDCNIADGVSSFAGSMCRKPYTEYCSGKFREADLTFCTNGGKCKSDFIAAEVAPGNFSVNEHYQHLGCVCNSDFYGPHCEFLRYNDRAVGSSMGAEDTGAAPITTFIYAGVGGIAAMSVLVLYAVHRRRRRRQKRSMAARGAAITPGGFSDGAGALQPQYRDVVGSYDDHIPMPSYGPRESEMAPLEDTASYSGVDYDVDVDYDIDDYDAGDEQPAPTDAQAGYFL